MLHCVFLEMVCCPPPPMFGALCVVFFTQVTSGEISRRLKEAEETEEKITTAREKYRPVAARGQ